MMKVTLAGCFLVVLVWLLMVSVAIAQKEDPAEVLMQAAHQRQPVEGGIQPYAKASLDIGECSEQFGNAETQEAYERLLRDYADQSDQVAAAGARLAVAGQLAGRSNGSTIVVGLIPVPEGPVHVLKTLRSEPQIISGVTDPGIPSWLYCKLHPRWCKNF